jgi:hypothetical protein
MVGVALPISIGRVAHLVLSSSWALSYLLLPNEGPTAGFGIIQSLSDSDTISLHR